MTRTTLALTLVTLAALVSAPARADVRITNRSQQQVQVALVYYLPSYDAGATASIVAYQPPSWVSKGWFTINPGASVVVHRKLTADLKAQRSNTNWVWMHVRRNGKTLVPKKHGGAINYPVVPNAAFEIKETKVNPSKKKFTVRWGTNGKNLKNYREFDSEQKLKAPGSGVSVYSGFYKMSVNTHYTIQ